MLIRALTLGMVLSAANPGYAGFYEDALTSKGSTMKQLLAKLKAKYPVSFSDDYTLVHTSHSLQRASFLEPRIILMAEDGKSLMALSGCVESGAVGHKIEFIDFGEDQRFHFNQLEFALAEADAATGPSVVQDVDCQSCHKGAPLWDAYPHWPSLYKSEPHTGRLMEFGLENPVQRSSYGEFLEKTVPKPQCFYSYLDNLASHHTHRPGYDPNTRISEALGYLNYRRIFATIARDPSYEQLRYSLTAAVIGCSDLEHDSAWIRKTDTLISFEELLSDTLRRQSASENEFTQNYYARDIARLRFVLQSTEIDIEEWSTSFMEKENYNLVMPVRTTVDFLSAMLAEYDDELSEYSGFRVGSRGGEYSILQAVTDIPNLDERCAKLRARARAAQSDLNL